MAITILTPTDPLVGTVTITCSITGITVDDVRFLVDKVIIDHDRTAPYTASWDTTLVADGSHEIKCKAFLKGARVQQASKIVQVANATQPPPPPLCQDPPVSTDLPVITGTATEGQTLTVDEGSWTNCDPASTGCTCTYAYQWFRCDAAGANPVPIPDQSNSYTLASIDIGATIRCAVTASNSVGKSVAATSLQTSVVQALVPAVPVNTVLPMITGSAVQNSTLSCSTGSWTNSPTSYAYQWRRCDSAGANPANITGATSPTYLVALADVGSTLRCRVTATNGSGAGTAVSSDQTGVVSAPPPPLPPPGVTINASPGQLATKIASANAGDTIVCLAGDHGGITLSRDFASPFLTIKCATGAYFSSTIDTGARSGYIFDGIVSHPALSADEGHLACLYVHGNSHDITIQNSNLSGSAVGIHIYSTSPYAQRINIINNEIHGNGIDMIHVDGVDGLLVEHNYLHDPDFTIDPSAHHDAFQVQDGKNWTFRRNLVVGLAQNITDGPNQCCMIACADPTDVITNGLIANNLMLWTLGRPINLNTNNNSPALTGPVRLVNNTIPIANTNGIAIGCNRGQFGSVGLIEIYNNIVYRIYYDTGQLGSDFIDTNWFTSSYVLGTNTHTGAPGFTSTGTPSGFGDSKYKLAAGAPARNFGVVRPYTPSVDMDNVARPGAAPVGLGSRIAT